MTGERFDLRRLARAIMRRQRFNAMRTWCAMTSAAAYPNFKVRR